jgi:predicted glutamine amidotransferase
MVVASERLDEDEGWRVVPDRHVLTVEESGTSLCPL